MCLSNTGPFFGGLPAGSLPVGGAPVGVADDAEPEAAEEAEAAAAAVSLVACVVWAIRMSDGVSATGALDWKMLRSAVWGALDQLSSKP
eukprot:4275991-Alexandrium_andersonii.AAC.1